MISAAEKIIEALKATSRIIRGKVSLYRGGTNTPLYTFAYNDNLQFIQIDRVSENNKFFGFGICQKATIHILDKDNQFTIKKNDKLTVSLGIDISGNLPWSAKSFPDFYVTDIQRDEKTGKLLVTAYDAIYYTASHTVEEVNLTSYTIRQFAEAIADIIGLETDILGLEDTAVFDTLYEQGANFDGTETLRAALDAIAEATQTVYFIRNNAINNIIVFKRLSNEEEPVLTIEKDDYYTLSSNKTVMLSEIGSVTELGDNVGYVTDMQGEAQYVYNNPFWDLREDIGELVTAAVAAVGGFSMTPYNLLWRGNFLLEIGDKIAIRGKDDSLITTYLLSDTINYNGGMNSVCSWEYKPTEKAKTNPATLGEAIKNTYAQVDKVNKQVEIVVSETTANKEAISSLITNTNSINASVSKIEKTTTERLGAVDGEIATLNKKVDAAITSEDVQLSIQNELSNGVDKVVTSTGFTFDENGLTVSKSGSEMKTAVTEDGMQVFRGSKAVLTANNTGVDAVNLHASTYLIIGSNSRFENYGSKRTGCFWIGG